MTCPIAPERTPAPAAPPTRARRGPNGLASLILAALVCALVIGVSPARAGTYEVAACNAAGGVNRSWQPSVSNAQAMVIRQRCPTTGLSDGLGTRTTTLALHVAAFTNAHWRFDAPAGTSIVGLEWSGELDTESPGWVSRIEGDTGTLRECNTAHGACGTVFRYGEAPIYQAVPGAHWLRALTICAAALGCDTGDGGQHAYAQNYMWSARVRISDPTPPALEVAGPLWSDGWHRGNQALQLTTRDASGALFDAVRIDGATFASHPFGCDYTTPRPCQDRSSAYDVPTAGLADGPHEVVVGSADAAANGTEARRTVYVDNHAPGAPAALRVDGGEGWRATNGFSVAWANPGQGTGSPVAAARLRLCRLEDPSACAPERRVAGRGVERADGLSVPDRGAWTLRVALEDEAGNTDPDAVSDPVVLRFDDSVPGTAAPVERGWLTRARAQAEPLAIRLADGFTAPPSGIAGYSVTTDGSAPDATVDATGVDAPFAVGTLPEGVTRVRARAISGAGVPASTLGETDVRIDATAPVAAVDPEPDPARWHREPVALRFAAHDQPGLSGLAAAAVGRPISEGAHLAIGIDDGPVRLAAGEETETTLTEDGRHRVAFRALDLAGNASTWRTIAVRVDTTAPETAAFLAADPADPRRVEAMVADRTSGIAGGVIRMRPAGATAWRDLTTTLRDGRLVALAHDDGLPPGPYEFEVAVADVAGNVRHGDRTVGGRPMIRVAPFRVATHLRAGLVAPAGRGRPERLVGTLAVANGRGARLRGTLATTDGRPVGGAPVGVWAATAIPGATAVRVGTARTDARGRLGWRAPSGPGRRITFRYAGTGRVFGAQASAVLRVAARTTLVAAPRTNRVGGTARFSGRLLGDHLPPGGKLVLVQAHVPGRGWQTFAATRASRTGRWATRYRFRATVGTVRYRIRAIVPAEAAYPFGRAVTRPVTIVVRG